MPGMGSGTKSVRRRNKVIVLTSLIEIVTLILVHLLNNSILLKK